MRSGGELTPATLGKTGAQITSVGLGAWAMGGGSWDFGLGAQDDAVSVRTIHAAVAHGVNWIDTAPVYGLGRSERIVGRAVRKLPEHERPLVFTKCGMVWEDGETAGRRVGRPESIRRECEESLRRLGVEAIDGLQLHWPPDDGTPLCETWGALVSLRDAGLIRFAGLSNVSPEELDECESAGHIDSLQAPLNLLRRGAMPSIEWAAKRGCGVLVYSPMQSGLLSGSWTRERSEALTEDDSRRLHELFDGEGLARSLALVDRLRPVADARGIPFGHLAIAWTLDQPGVTAAIVGARRPEQIDGWVRAGDVRLTPHDRATIAQALEEADAPRRAA